MCHEVLPSADFSRGAVYLTGASNMSWAVRNWDLPERLARSFTTSPCAGRIMLTRSTCIDSSSSERISLPPAARSRLSSSAFPTHGTHNARIKIKGPNSLYMRYWTRRGFYTIDDNGTIREQPLNALFRTLIVERVKIFGPLEGTASTCAYTPFKSPRVINGPLFIRERSEAMGSVWKQKIETETAAFEQFIEYLKRHQVKVVVIRMPQGSWKNKLRRSNQPTSRAWRRICAKAGVELLDYSRFLDDQDFADSIHLAPRAVSRNSSRSCSRWRSSISVPSEHSGNAGAKQDRELFSCDC